jgi:hypothetical protein
VANQTGAEQLIKVQAQPLDSHHLLSNAERELHNPLQATSLWCFKFNQRWQAPGISTAQPTADEFRQFWIG